MLSIQTLEILWQDAIVLHRLFIFLREKKSLLLQCCFKTALFFLMITMHNIFFSSSIYQQNSHRFSVCAFLLRKIVKKKSTEVKLKAYDTHEMNDRLANKLSYAKRSSVTSAFVIISNLNCAKSFMRFQLRDFFFSPLI